MTKIIYRDFFDEFRPYTEAEAKEAMKRLEKSAIFYSALKFFFPNKTQAEFREMINSVCSVYDFQANIMAPILNKIITDSAQGIHIEGIENPKKNSSYIFISNHRDIFLDAAINQYALLINGLKTAEITFGDNLMSIPEIIDAGKINKMFKVYRSGKPKELMEKTAQLSEYIHYAQCHKKESIWIAQRGGRTKDGNDQTQYGVLKMLCAARKGKFTERLKNLNIMPVSMSYEFEPNDHFKARELFLSKEKPYTKRAGEDIHSIIDGIKGYKGKIYIHFGKQLNEEFDQIPDSISTNAQAKLAAKIIDKEIHKNYKLFPNNYIAADISLNSKTYSKHYTQKQKETFIKYLTRQLLKLEFSDPELTKLCLNIYACPVFNKEKLN